MPERSDVVGWQRAASGVRTEARKRRGGHKFDIETVRAPTRCRTNDRVDRCLRVSARDASGGVVLQVVARLRVASIGSTLDGVNGRWNGKRDQVKPLAIAVGAASSSRLSSTVSGWVAPGRSGAAAPMSVRASRCSSSTATAVRRSTAGRLSRTEPRSVSSARRASVDGAQHRDGCDAEAGSGRVGGSSASGAGADAPSRDARGGHGEKGGADRRRGSDRLVVDRWRHRHVAS